MKIVFDIDDELARDLEEESARRGSSVSTLVELGIMQILAEMPKPKKPKGKPKPLPAFDSGGHRVDISNRGELYKVMDRDRDIRLYGKPLGRDPAALNSPRIAPHRQPMTPRYVRSSSEED